MGGVVCAGEVFCGCRVSGVGSVRGEEGGGKGGVGGVLYDSEGVWAFQDDKIGGCGYQDSGEGYDD